MITLVSIVVTVNPYQETLVQSLKKLFPKVVVAVVTKKTILRKLMKNPH